MRFKIKKLGRIRASVGFEILWTVVCNHFGIEDRGYLRQNKRNIEIVKPRQILMYFGIQCKGVTLERVGNEFGQKDHATVLHAKKTIEKLTDKVNGNIVDAKLYDEMAEIKGEIEELLDNLYIPSMNAIRHKRKIYHYRTMPRKILHNRKMKERKLVEEVFQQTTQPIIGVKDIVQAGDFIYRSKP